LLLAAVVLTAAAWNRGAEYDEQYTLFVTSGTPRPIWPRTVFPASDVLRVQAGHAGLATVARDLRHTDVHPPLYFWAVAMWRHVAGDGLFAVRTLSVAFGLGALVAVGAIARRCTVPPALAMLLTLGCYGFAYTGGLARGFALAQMLTLLGIVGVLGRRWALAGALLGCAVLANYLAVFVAGAVVVLAIAAPSYWWPEPLADVFRSSPVMAGLDPMGIAHRRIRSEIDGRRVARQRWQPRPGPPTPSWPSSTRPSPARVARSEKSRVFNCLPSPEMARSSSAMTDGKVRWLHPLQLATGFLPPVLLAAWFFLAQRDSRPGQFPPFELLPVMVRVARYYAANLTGGLPLYMPETAQTAVAAILAIGLAALTVSVLRRWNRDLLLTVGALAPPLGLLALGFAFDNTPIELRYLSFATPFAALLVAGSRPRAWVLAAILTVQSASIAGLIFRPETMQPARAAAALANDGVVLIPRGNDGIGIVGAFAMEAPPALPLLIVGPTDSPDEIRRRINGFNRATLALLAQDGAAQAAIPTMRAAFAGPGWREIASGVNIVAYERIAEPE
jgi:hypothetical protein